MQLTKYQEQVIQDLKKLRRRRKRFLVTVPIGIGKRAMIKSIL